MNYYMTAANHDKKILNDFSRDGEKLCNFLYKFCNVLRKFCTVLYKFCTVWQLFKKQPPFLPQKRRFRIVFLSVEPAHFDDSPKYLTHFIGLLAQKPFFGNLGNLQQRPGTKQTPISTQSQYFPFPLL